MMEVPRFGVSEFVEVVNQALDYAFSIVEVVGEVGEYRVSQGKWVSFKLKDAEMSVEAFLVKANLGVELEDGMKVVVRAVPRLTKWGRFSLNVRAIKLVGEGDIRRSFLLLQKKLEKEGLFEESRKRKIPEGPTRIAVISSTEAAGYKDFVKILESRWGGLSVEVAHTQVQGVAAAEQMMRALAYLNEHSEAEVVVMIRGGGAREDLSAFDDERLVRAIAASRIPVLTGVGHEVDVTLADLVADERASTPSNAAERITRDRQEVVRGIRGEIKNMGRTVVDRVEREREVVQEIVIGAGEEIERRVEAARRDTEGVRRTLAGMNPEEVLRRGYAIINGKIEVGGVVKITTVDKAIRAEVTDVKERG